MESGKTGKYLKYAIGEILLVVIGILIALQINNWNQNMTEKRVLRSILQEIKTDLETDIEILEDNIIKYDSLLSDSRWGLSKTTYENSPIDSLVPYLYLGYSDDKLSDIGFTKLQNLGSSHFFEFEALVNQIRKFYLVKGKKFNIMVDWDTDYTTRNIVWLQSQENAWETTHLSSVIDDSFKVGQFPSLKNKQENLDAVFKILNSTKFRNYEWDDIRRKEILKSLFEEMIIEATELINAIDIQIKE
jgi:hypothetical protein